MKTMVSMAILWLALAAAGNAQGISVSSPSAGSSWCQGDYLAINWTKTGDWSLLDLMAGTKHVTIQLRSSAPAGPVLAISTGALNKGTFSWLIPGTVAAGNYRVRVQTMDRRVTGVSEAFSIASCIKTITPGLGPRLSPLKPILKVSLGRIEGGMSGFSQSLLIRGHKVRVVLKKAGDVVTSAVYVLDAQGRCHYRFLSLPRGIYEVEVEKVATRLADLPPESLNVCFMGTTPTAHTVVLDDATMESVGNDFLINYVLTFGSARPSCW